MSFQEELARRLWGPGESEGEAFAVLRLIVRHAGRGEKLDDYSIRVGEGNPCTL